MTERYMPSVETLEPGDIIELADITELPRFEDLVAVTIDHQVEEAFPESSTRLNLAAWAGRSAIGELIRPKKPKPFNGTIANLRLEVMADAYDRLRDANQRGWHFMQGAGSGIANQIVENEINKPLFPIYKGFRLSAEATSSGKGVIGEIQTELWYIPVPMTFQAGQAGGNIRQHAKNSGGASVKRFVAKPQLETDKFVKHDETSRRIGLEVLRHNMRHPIIETMRN